MSELNEETNSPNVKPVPSFGSYLRFLFIVACLIIVGLWYYGSIQNRKEMRQSLAELGLTHWSDCPIDVYIDSGPDSRGKFCKLQIPSSEARAFVDAVQTYRLSKTEPVLTSKWHGSTGISTGWRDNDSWFQPEKETELWIMDLTDGDTPVWYFAASPQNGNVYIQRVD